MDKKLKIVLLVFTIIISLKVDAAQTEPSSPEAEFTPSDHAFNHMSQDTDESNDHTDYEHTDEELRAIAQKETNTDLVGLLDTLEPEQLKPQEDNSDIDTITNPVIEGIDTVDLEQPQGNWLFKRAWWQRSEARYEKIKKLIEEIFEHRMVFFEKRSELVKHILDPFYFKMGMGQGEFQATLNDLIVSLEQQREKKGSLAPQERELLNLLESQKEVLDQLVVDVSMIGEIEHRVDESLSKLLEQIRSIRSYDAQAWDAFKEIARVVDDEKARQLYYKIEAASRNIKDIAYYLENSFAAHFDQLITTIKDHVRRVEETVAALKEKGIDFKRQVEQATQPKPIIQEEDQEKEEEVEDEGFIQSYILTPLSSFFETVVSWITWPYYAIFGSSDKETEENIDA